MLGSKLGKAMKDVASKIQAFKSDSIATILEGMKHKVEYGDGQAIEIGKDDLVIQRNEKENLKILNEGELTVGFATEVKESLLHEGIARDVVRSIQTMRKDMGLDVSDRIVLVVGGDEVMEKVYGQFRSFIESETLAVSSSFNPELDAPETESGARIRIEKSI